MSPLTDIALARARAIGADNELTASSVGQLISLAGAAGRAKRPAQVYLQVGVGDRAGCSPEAWPVLVAVACRLTRAGRVEVLGIRSGRRADQGPGGPDAADATERLERAVTVASRLGLRMPAAAG